MAGLLLFSGGCARIGPLASSRKPPVIVITVDTLRADHLPLYGYRGVATPNVDALARDSVLFRNAYAHVPLTLASHATLFTGLLPAQNGIRDNLGFVLRPGVATMATVLQDRGYATGGAVSAEVLSRGSGIDRGFDFWDDAVQQGGRFERDGRKTADALLEWVEKQGARPVFAFLHLFEPHAPYEPPEPYRSRYPLAYDGEIARADEILGSFLEGLKSRKLYEGSVIVFLSDHGEGLGEHGEPEHGVFLYREDLHVPLLLKLPQGRRAGEAVDIPVALTDVLPTLAVLTGAAAPAGLAGRDLLQPPASARRIYSESLYPRLRLGWSDLASLVDDRYHYIEAPKPELYDLAADPGERTDLSRGLSPAFRSMRAELLGLDRPFEMPGPADPERARKLVSLGYLSATSPSAGGRGLPDPKDQIGLLEDYRHFQDLLARKDDGALVAACRRFLARVPAALDVWRLLADALERGGKRKEAVAALEEGLKASAATAAPALRTPALERLTDLLLRSGRTPEALALADTDSFTDPEALNAVGVAQGRAGRSTDAQRSFQRVLSLDPDNAVAHFNLGTALLDSGDAKGASEHFERSVQSDPKSALGWSSLGLARASLGDEAGAMASWKRALELDGAQFAALYNLAIAQGRRGEVDAAREKLQRFVARAPAAVYGKDLAEARRLLKSMGGA